MQLKRINISSNVIGSIFGLAGPVCIRVIALLTGGPLNKDYLNMRKISPVRWHFRLS